MMSAAVRFHRLQPIPPAHPRPWFPTLPVLGTVGRTAAPFAADSRFLAADAVLTPSGKVATYWALRGAGVQSGDRVAVPAYHCPTMIYPIIAVGAQPVFIPVGERLQLGADVIARVLDQGVRALVLPHFFGFIQPEIDEIQRLCQARGVVLIEDCAHAMYARRGSRLPGTWGDFAIASTRKFIASSEGGALVSNKGIAEHPRRGASLRQEVRGLWYLADDAYWFGSVPMLAWLRGKAKTTLIGPANDQDAVHEASPTLANEDEVTSSANERLALRSVQCLVRRSDHDLIAAVRRQRFEQWADAVSGCPHVEPYATQLTVDQVPYVFPVRLKRPAAQFSALKYQGVSVWRWDHLAESDCRVSARLALELVQMPCQHTMSNEAFSRLVREFLKAVASA